MFSLDAAELRGYLVHAYTASTLAFVALATHWILLGEYRLALGAFAITILIDATDGTLARKYRVKETAAGIDGELLDNIVDFLSYVMLPMLFLMHAQMLEGAVLVVTFVMFASAFGFSRTTAKLANEGFFVGFPSYWNIVAFYLFLLQTPALFNSILLVALGLLVFVPVKFLYVSRLPRGRTLHVALGSAWGLLCAGALLLGPGDLASLMMLLSLSYPVYYTAHSLMLDAQQREERRLQGSSSD